MKRILSGLAVILVAGLVSSTAAQAATSGTSTVTLAATANTMIQILDAAVTLTPNATDYNNDFVDAAGASGLRVRVKSNSSTGMALLVRCSDATPQIALADLLFKTATAAGTGGTTQSSYTAITAVDQTLWTTTVSQNPFLTVTSDLRVQNLFNYNDAGTAGTTSYTNTLTYSVITQ
jgi:hypothetical protein